MKLTSQTTTAAFLATGLLAAGSADAALIHAVGVNNQGTSGSSFITSWAALGVDGNETTETLSGIAGNVDGEAFTYDITIASIDTTNLSLSGSGFVNGGTFDLTISNISNANVQFDGFVRYSYANANNAEGATINGTAYTRGANGLSPDLDPVITSTLEVRTINSTTGRYADFQFSAVPEPGSLALLGLGGLLIARRRRNS